MLDANAGELSPRDLKTRRGTGDKVEPGPEDEFVPVAVVPDVCLRFQAEKKHDFERADHVFKRQSPVYFASQPVPTNNRRSVAAAVQWLHRHDAHRAPGTCANSPVSPMVSLNTVQTKSDGPLKSPSGGDQSTSDSKGLPSAEQLNYIYNKLGEDVSLF